MILLRIANRVPVIASCARPQDASRALDHLSLLSGSARSHLDAYKQRMLHPVSEVAEVEARLFPAGRCVDQVFQPSTLRGFPPRSV